MKLAREELQLPFKKEEDADLKLETDSFAKQNEKIRYKDLSLKELYYATFKRRSLEWQPGPARQRLRKMFKNATKLR